jgi:hypothetical protein
MLSKDKKFQPNSKLLLESRLCNYDAKVFEDIE